MKTGAMESRQKQGSPTRCRKASLDLSSQISKATDMKSCEVPTCQKHVAFGVVSAYKSKYLPLPVLCGEGNNWD